MMQLQLQDKRCVFNSQKEDKPPTIEKTIVGEEILNKNIEEVITSNKEDLRENEQEIADEEIESGQGTNQITKEQTIEEDIGLKPKRKGYNLFTITSNIKTASGKFVVTKIIEEINDKKAKILYEKEVKKELGKPRSITKFTINPYSAGDKESTEEIIEETPSNRDDETKEMSLFEQALEILCTSPYIHIFRIPYSKQGTNKYHYDVFENEEHLNRVLKENLERAQNEIDNADLGVDELNREKRKEAERVINSSTKLYQRMVSGAKQLSGQEIKNDKNVMRYIGKQDDEWYKNVIELHQEKDYEKNNRLTLARENIMKIVDSEEYHMYLISIKEIKNSTALIAARTSEQANEVGMCSQYILDLLKENTPEVNGEREVNVNSQVAQLERENVEKIIENDDALNQILDRTTFITEMVVKKNFSLDKLKNLLDRIEIVVNMTDEEKENAVKKLLSKSLPERLKESINFISTTKLTEKLNEIKGEIQ